MYRKTLILNNRQVKKLIDMPSVLKVVEDVFRSHAKGLVQMPPKIYLHLDKYSGDFRAMPAYIQRQKVSGLKWVNVHPKNRRFGLPAVMAVIILSDPKTGFPLAVMDGTEITNLRTGAAGGIAAKFLARKNSSVIALVGCGVQARTQLLALKELFRIEKVFIWGCKPQHAKKFLKDMRYLGLSIEIKQNIADCVKDADIIATTTPSRKPIVKFEWIKKGVHINAIGADAKGKEELDPKILKNARIVVDDKRQAAHSGEINVPLSKGLLKERNIYAELGQIINGKKKSRVKNDEITVFDSTGLAIQDMAVADYVYKKALKHKIGRLIGIV
ncbi:alanine dehydrogenase [bacterium]|nr:MAG: alanine dehydrogenase [bacterium]